MLFLNTMTKEVLFVRVRRGKYKVFFVSHDLGVICIPQKEIAEVLLVLYDEELDALSIANVPNKRKILLKVGITAPVKEG